MRALDLFCCAGGATRGYQLAGFHVTGVDSVRHPRYVGDAFIQTDATSLSPAFLATFDFIHASPPCQFGTELRHAPNTKEHPNLIPQTRDLLKRSGRPYVIENVRAVRPHLIDPTLLCGSMFGLGAAGYQLQRHRLFEANWELTAPSPCRHTSPVIGVYGAHVRCRSAKHGGRRTADFEGHDKPALAAEAMGIGWMTMAELSEAIPPAYAQWVGSAFLASQAIAADERAA